MPRKSEQDIVRTGYKSYTPAQRKQITREEAARRVPSVPTPPKPLGQNIDDARTAAFTRAREHLDAAEERVTNRLAAHPEAAKVVPHVKEAFGRVREKLAAAEQRTPPASPTPTAQQLAASAKVNKLSKGKVTKG